MKPFRFSKRRCRGQKQTIANARRSILVMLGKCFAEQKQFQKAAEMMETAIGVSGEDQKNELMYEISKLYIAAGQPDKAIENLNRIKATEDPFWGAVAQQQINTIEYEPGRLKFTDIRRRQAMNVLLIETDSNDAQKTLLFSERPGAFVFSDRLGQVGKKPAQKGIPRARASSFERQRRPDAGFS